MIFPVFWKRKGRTERRTEFWDCYQFVCNIMQMHFFYSYMYLKCMCWAEVSMPVQNCMQFKKGRIYLTDKIQVFQSSPWGSRSMTAHIGPEKRENVREQEIKRKMDTGEGRDREQRKRGGQGVEGGEGRRRSLCSLWVLLFPSCYFICTSNRLTVVNCV